jgi:RNA polymerase sigma factor (TIGR02999 family)
MQESSNEITHLLQRWQQGDRDALDQLMPIVYDELRRLARHYLSGERREHTLQPTALVNEAYLRLVDQRSAKWANRAQFFGVAANMMRRILVDHAREKNADKRRMMKHAVSLDEALSVPAAEDLNLVALDESLNALASVDEGKCKIVELRFFVGLPVPEVAEVLGMSEATVKREWSFAKAWLYRDMTQRSEAAEA